MSRIHFAIPSPPKVGEGSLTVPSIPEVLQNIFGSQWPWE